MQYSLVGYERRQPFPKGKGTCEICKSDTVAKCGEKVMWHWAHKSKQTCDPWWENETEWHRNWKAEFPESYREVAYTCPKTGEIHRADIATERGIFLEIQNSPISLEELRSRETFYKNLVWIVNGEKFKDRFRIFNAYLPDPTNSDFDDIVFQHSENEHSCTMYYRKSENQEALKDLANNLVEMHSTRDIKNEIETAFVGHHPFFWQRPHISWLEAKCPVFIDFGEDVLWRIERYRNAFLCVRAIARQKVIHDINTETHVADITSRFYIVNSW